MNSPDQDYENGPGFIFVIDPLGTAAAIQSGATDYDVFPFADFTKTFPDEGPWLTDKPKRWGVRRLTLPVAGTLDSPSRTRMRFPFAEAIFRMRDDVTNELPRESDRPGIQRWTTVDSTNGSPNNTPSDPSDDTLVSRSYAGNYTWLATVVPTSIESYAALQPVNSRFGSDLYEVSVVVFNKREILPSVESERAIRAFIKPGKELVLYNPNDQEGSDGIDAATQDVRAGDWVAIAGYVGITQFTLKWYRILSIDDETLPKIIDGAPGAACVRHAILDGPEFPNINKVDKGRGIINLRAIFLPGVISVTTRMLPMERAD